jgi:hypothetical protein
MLLHHAASAIIAKVNVLAMCSQGTLKTWCGAQGLPLHQQYLCTTSQAV